MKPLIWFIFLTTILTLPLNSYSSTSDLSEEEKKYIKKNNPFTLLAVDEFRPFSFRENGELKGFTVDLLKLISSKTGLRIDVKTGKWHENLEAFENGKYDLISGITPTEERKKYTFFSPYYYRLPILIYATNDFTKYSGISDLENKTAGIEKDIFYKKDLKRIKNLKIKEYPDPKELMKSLAYKKIDVAFATLYSGNYYTKKYGLGNIKILGEYSSDKVESEDLSIGVSKKNPILFSIIEKEFMKITDEEFESLRDKWTGLYKDKPEQRVLLSTSEKEFLLKHPVIYTGSQSDWGPFNFNKNGKAMGFSIDYLKLVGEKTGLNFRFVKKDSWDDLLTLFKNKEIDLLPFVFKTDERKRYSLFSEPYFNGNLAVYINSENDSVKSLNDISGQKIALLKSDAACEIILNKFPDIEPVYYEKTENLFKSLSAKKTEAIINSPFVIEHFVMKNQIVDIRLLDYIDLSEKESAELAMHFGVRKEMPELKSIIDKGIEKIENSKINELEKKWISPLFSDDFLTERASDDLKNRINLSSEEKQYLKKRGPVKVCVESNWKPLEFIDEKDQYQGMLADYIKLFEKIIGKEIKNLDTSSWSQVIELAKKGKCDILSAVIETEERKDYLNFTTPYIEFPYVIATKRKVKFIENLKYVLDKKFVVISGFAVSDKLREEYPEIKLIEAQNTEKALIKVSSGQAYGYIDASPVISYNLQKHGRKDLKITGRLDYSMKLCVGVKKDDPLLLSIFSKAVKSLSESNHKQIYNKWITVKYEQGFNYSLFWKITPVIIIIMIFFLYWNMKLSLEISKRKKAETELLDAKIKAEIANRTKSEFLANMTHELRTPLNAVIGFSDLLSSLDINKEQKSYVESIKTSGRSLLTLINDILDLSKIEAGMLEINPSALNIRTLLSEISMIFKPQMEEKGLEYIMEIDKSVPEVLVLDEIRIRQVLLNIIGNALKFTDKGYVKVKLDCFLKDESKTRTDLCFSIEDTGIGISEKGLTTVFETFRQESGQNLKKYGGTGLGLSISKKLVKAMGGEISVSSTLGKGSVFKIYLKNIMSDLSQKELAKFEKSFDFNELEFEKALILAVDDVASNRNIISEILVKAGLTVETAENGEKAVEFISQKKPDLILMDIIMPGMDGVEATRKIKASEGCKNIPVIALTASAGFLKTRSVLNIFDDYLEKPYRLVELLNVLLKYLNYTKKIKRKNELKNKETINLKDIKNPDKLIKILNNEILPEAEILKNAVIVGRTRELGAKVKELGSLHKSDLLSDCGAKLISSCEYFDIEKIEEEIKKLFSLIININKLREGDDEK